MEECFNVVSLISIGGRSPAADVGGTGCWGKGMRKVGAVLIRDDSSL